MHRTFLQIVALMLVSWPGPAAAQAQRSYPDVWERALAIPGGWSTRVLGSDYPEIGRRQDGEVVISFTHGEQFHAVEFFSGRTLSGPLQEKPAVNTLRRNLSDAWSVLDQSSPRESDCHRSFPANLSFSLGPTKQSFHLIARPARPRQVTVKACRDHPVLTLTEAAFAPPVRTFVLDDDSFIAVMPELGRAVRIRRDLSSPALDGRRLYLVREGHMPDLADPVAMQDAVVPKLDSLPPAHAQRWVGPPYPNIWERRLAIDPSWDLQDWIARTGSPIVGRRPDGEVVMVMIKEGRFVATEFFSGRSESGLLSQRPILEGLRVVKVNRLADRRFLYHAESAYEIDGCYDGLGPALRIRQDDKTVSRDYRLIARLEQPRAAVLRPDCAEQKDLRYSERILAPGFRVHALEDGTFLMVAPEIGKAIRVRGDLSSPAIDRRSLYLMQAWYVDEDGDMDAAQKHDRVLAMLDSLPPAHAPNPDFKIPYPGLWRRALPDLGPPHTVRTLAGVLPNGDVAIALRSGDRHAVVEFFAGRVTVGRVAWEKARRGIAATSSLWERHLGDSPDTLDRNIWAGVCYHGFLASYPHGPSSPDERWWLIAYLDHPRKPPLRPACSMNTVDYDEYVFAVPLTQHTPLDDGSTIVVAPDIGAALRLRPGPTSPVIDGRALSVVYGREIMLKRAQAKEDHDAMRAYLDKRRRSDLKPRGSAGAASGRP